MVKSRISRSIVKRIFCIIITGIMICLLSGCEKQPETEEIEKESMMICKRIYLFLLMFYIKSLRFLQNSCFRMFYPFLRILTWIFQKFSIIAYSLIS